MYQSHKSSRFMDPYLLQQLYPHAIYATLFFHTADRSKHTQRVVEESKKPRLKYCRIYMSPRFPLASFI